MPSRSGLTAPSNRCTAPLDYDDTEPVVVIRHFMTIGQVCLASSCATMTDSRAPTDLT